jgi:hypothetical protein
VVRFALREAKMAWTTLASRLNNLPRVLAGPVLRKVTSEEVTVWVVVRRPASVVLKVMGAASDIRLLEGQRHTVAVGANLHIVAVTAKRQPPAAELAEGRIYRYDMVFEFDDGVHQTLSMATAGTPLAYSPFDKPSFCLPPADINQLRLIHGSCRIPHGNGADALPMLDNLINQGADNPYARPHQLLLTGDQIYADDVGFAMSMMLMDAGEALLGWSEEVPIQLAGHLPRYKIIELNPAIREEVLHLNAGITSVDLVGHLIGLGEYIAMYLFVWSDVLWPAAPATLPTFQEIVTFFQAREMGSYAELGLRQMHRQDRDGVNQQTARTSDFGRSVKNVRRALANIPSYMIFDDHDVTDDWNMTRDFCKSVYGSELGLRIVQNALVAYALCQHWGNAPEQFRSPTSVSSPGEKLLLALDGINATSYEASSEAIRGLVGVHRDAVLATRPDNGLFHDPGSFIYNYTVEAPGYQVIVTDTRSWRSYPRGPTEGSDFLPGAQLQAQIASAPDPGNRALLVVLTTNAPPTQPIRTASRYPHLTRRLARAFDNDACPDMYEAWEMPRNATDRLFKAISDKQPVVGGKRYGRAILLSGDVHTSFASRLLLNGRTRFEDPQNKPQPVSMVFAQLVSSSLRKETTKTLGMHRDGYDYAPTGAGWLVPANEPEGYIGWNVPSGVQKLVAKRKIVLESLIKYNNIVATGPKTLSLWDAEWGVLAVEPVDWSYRLDYLLAVLQAPLPDVPPPIPPMPTGNSPEDRRRAADAFHKATGSYRKFNKANVTRQEMVGVNNIGEITFDWGAGDAKFVLHTLRWRDADRAADMFTTYVCSLNPNDPNFDPNDPRFPKLRPLPP